MRKHTQGPWFVSKTAGFFCVDSIPRGKKTPWGGDYRIAKTYASPLAPEYEEAKANARLIAAAPELLNSLKEVLAAWTYIDEEHDSIYEKAKKLIAKAEGDKQ